MSKLKGRVNRVKAKVVICARTHLAKWNQLHYEIMFELSYVRRVVSGNQLPRIFHLQNNRTQLGHGSADMHTDSCGGIVDTRGCVCVCVCHLSRNVALQEVNEPHRFLLLREIKVHTVSECHDVKTVGVRVVFQQQLF